MEARDAVIDKQASQSRLHRLHCFFAFIALLLYLTLGHTTANSQSCGIDGSGKTCQAGVGNPINAMTGNKYQQEVDLPALPGVLGLEIVRHYNSTLSRPSDAPGIVGRGWKLSYETELRASGSTIDIRGADGTLHTFICDALNVQRCDSEDHTQGSVRRQRAGNGGGAGTADAANASSNDYLWTWNDGRVLRFNQRGKLVQIEAPTGEFVVLQYDARQMLMAVTDPQGRRLQLHYPDRAVTRTSDTYRGVEWIDSPIGRFDYRYGSSMPKAATLTKGYLLANLVRVEGPVQASSATATTASTAASTTISAGTPTNTPTNTPTVQFSRVYHYEDALRPTYLTGITHVGISSSSGTASGSGTGTNNKLTEQRYATFGYNADGKAILSTHADNIDKATLDYRSGGQTIVTNSLGQTTVYKYAVLAGHYRLLEVRGAGCALCGTPNRHYGYDALGRLNSQTTLTAQGEPIQTIQTDLDYYGRPLAVHRIGYHDGKAQPAQWQVRYAYGEGTGDTPILIMRPSVVPGRELTTKISYNKFDQPVAVTQSGWAPAIDGKGEATAIERTTRYAYSVINGRSVLAQIDGPLANGPSNSPADSDVTMLKYDASGSFVVETVAPGMRRTRVTERSETGLPQKVIDPYGQSISIAYDNAGHITEFTRAGVSERFTYNGLGQLTSVVQPTGQQLHFTYGPAGKLNNVFDAQSNTIEIERDTEGVLVARNLRNPDGSIAQTTDLSRYVVDSEAPRKADGTGARGRTAQITTDTLTDPNGSITRVMRHADGLPAEIVEPGSTITHLAYDVNRQLTNLTDARGHHTGQQHDDFSRLVKVTSPDGGITLFGYDAADHLLHKTLGYGSDQASSIQYRYDVVGRVVAQSSAEGSTTITYGVHGKPVRITYPTGEEQFSYDAAGHLVTHLRLIDGQRFITAYLYDQRGRLTQKILPDRQILHYHYNGAVHARAGLLASITREDLFGRTVLLEGLNNAGDRYAHQRYDLANGVRYQRDLNQQGQITDIGSPGSWEEHHQRDAVGQLIQRSASGAGGSTTAGYAYDQLGRLNGAAYQGREAAGTPTPPGARGYHYDPTSNLLAQTLGDKSTRYNVDPNSNRILSAQTDGQVQPYVYNAAGSVTQIGTTRYRWDSQQRLINVTDAGKPVADYAYNAFGERIKKISYANYQKKVTYFFYDGSELVAEAQANEGTINITRQYVWLEDQSGARPIALLQARQGAGATGIKSIAGNALKAIPAEATQAAGQASRTDVFAIVTDHTGAPRAMVNDQKQTVWRADVTGFGDAVLKANNRVTLNLRGSNQYFDEETQLHYNARRYLDTHTGRYLSADPSGLAGGINLYAFADNNPIANVDPLGLQAKPTNANVSGWTTAERIKYVFERTAEKFPGELGDALRDLVSPTALATTAGVFAIWGAAQFTPAGWVADVVVVGISAVFLGKGIWDVTSGVFNSASSILNAKCVKDLQDAADVLAKGLAEGVIATGGAIGGVSTAGGTSKIAKLVRQIFKGGKSTTAVGEAYNVANAAKLAKQLSLQSKRSPFLPDGRLSQEAINSAVALEKFGPGQLKNDLIPSGFGKYTTKVFQSPTGNFEVHFYKNPTTGEVFYGLDYKAVFSNKFRVTKIP